MSHIPIFTVPPIRDLSVEAVNEWVASLNVVLRQIHDTIAKAVGEEGGSPVFAADVDLQSHNLVNVAQIGSGTTAPRLLPTSTTLPTASGSVAVVGNDTVNRRLIETTLSDLGIAINSLSGTLRTLVRH